MCSKKLTIIISFIIILVMGGIYTTLQLRLYTPEMKEFAKSIIPISNDIKEFFKNISLGFFTGAAVTGGIAISDYRIERRKTLIEFENASFEFLQNFRNFSILYILEPLELIQNYYGEIEHNRMSLQNNCQSRKSILAWIESHKENYVQLEMECDSFSAETKLNEIIKKYDNVIDTIMQEYRECEKIDSAKMRKTYFAIDFLFANRRIKKKFIYNQILVKQLQLYSEIKTLGNESDGMPRSMQIDRILQIQEKIVEEQNKDISICYYNRFYYEISCCLYKIRKLTYGFKYKDNKPELSMFLIGKPILKLKDMNSISVKINK